MSVRRLFGRTRDAERVLAALPQAVLTVDVLERVRLVNAAAGALLATIAPPAPRPVAPGDALHGALETTVAGGARVCALCQAFAEDVPTETDLTVAGDDAAGLRATFTPLLERGARVGLVVTLAPPPTAADAERHARARSTREMHTLLADLAHELNNPLTVILASAGMLRDSVEDEVSRRRLGLVAEAAERCAGIVRAFRATLAELMPDAASPPAMATTPPHEARILVVDDEPAVANAIATALATDGHIVDIVGDGVAALARLSAGRYDVILSDVRMPRLDGPGLYREVARRHPELVGRIVFVTGEGGSSPAQRFLDTVAAPTIPKPFDPRQLRAAVRRLVPHARTRDIA